MCPLGIGLEDINLDLIKTAAKNDLNHYLKHSFWVGLDRKKQVKLTNGSINSKRSLTQLTDLINNAKIISKQTDTTKPLRRLFQRSSRFRHTLDFFLSASGQTSIYARQHKLPSEAQYNQLLNVLRSTNFAKLYEERLGYSLDENGKSTELSFFHHRAEIKKVRQLKQLLSCQLEPIDLETDDCPAYTKLSDNQLIDLQQNLAYAVAIKHDFKDILDAEKTTVFKSLLVEIIEALSLVKYTDIDSVENNIYMTPME